MGVREILSTFIQDLDPAVKEIVADVLVAEQRKIDMQRPRGIKDDIKIAIERRIRAEESSR